MIQINHNIQKIMIIKNLNVMVIAFKILKISTQSTENNMIYQNNYIDIQYFQIKQILLMILMINIIEMGLETLHTF